MKRLLFILINICFCTSIFAQEEREIKLCTQAEEAYKIGQFDEVENILSSNVTSFSSRPKVTALRLLALSCIERDQTKQAEQYVSQLLKEDPYYNIAMTDPVRFADMVERMKRGEEATIVTASQQAESLSEAPVPVTLITEEMIKQSGARNLADLLLLYVPGMSFISGAEMNVAMHGIHSSSQEKILIMLDGHRLNSRTTNAEAPDYRTSLDKIKQIEVLRGPASSLYGNVALTAVVNIITKKGRDIDGVKMTAGIGDNKTYRADFLMGKRGLGIEFMGWASFFVSQGEKRYIGVNDEAFFGKIPQPGYMYLDGYNRKPSYDIGFTAQWNDLKLMFSMQDAKKVTPYNTVFFTGLYSYDKYRKINGVQPGHARKTTSVDLTYEKQWNEKWYGKISAFMDFESSVNYDAGGDSVLLADRMKYIIPGEVVDSLDVTRMFDKGIYQYQSWQDYTYGFNMHTNFSFDKGDWNGNVLFGLQLENYSMKDNTFLLGDHFDRILVTYSEANKTLKLGNELNVSPFAQLKTKWNDRLIFNGGLRFDYKHRFDGKKLYVFSPRLSLIYQIQHNANLKLSYSHSFVDAPFLYRASNLWAHSGGNSLNPEKMDAVQLTFDGSLLSDRLVFQTNVYYNKLTDLVYYDTEKLENMYSNAGSLDLLGVEQVVSYSFPRSKIHFNLSYQHVLDYLKYTANNSYIYDVPKVTMNMLYAYQMLKSKKWGDAFVRINMNVLSKQKSPLVDPYLFKGDKPFRDMNNETPARAIVNLGVDYLLGKVSVSGDIYNLLNTKYVQGGGTPAPLPIQGLNFIVKLGYKF